MGVKSKKKAKTRLDAYYRLAKDQGYRSRAAFKLIQLNRKYDFLAKSRVLVDLCAAPGGWCQVAAKNMPVGSKIVGVDLVPIAPIRGVKTFVGDITDDKTRKMILTWLRKEPVDCVIHDGAPNVGGVWSRDLYDQNALVLCSVKLAANLLKPGGWFVTKVFRSQDFQKLIWVFKQLFDKVETTKPLASRMESAEIFVVCGGYKAPKHIDPKMFSAQAVFADVGAEKIVSPSGTLLVPKSNVPQGYDDFSTISHRVATMSQYIACEEPKEFLRAHHEIRFPEEDRHYLQSRWSRKELVYLCQDLQQVGDADRRRLMRWREQLIREQARIIQAEQDNVEHGTGSEDSEEGSDVDSNAAAGSDADSEDDIKKMAIELLEMRKKKLKEAKKKQAKVVDRKIKQVKGLIGYDPTSSGEHLTDVNGFSRGDEMLGSDDDGAAGEEGEGDWSMANVAEVPEELMAKMFDKHYEEADTHDQTPLQTIASVNLKDEKDYDDGDGEEDDEGPDEGEIDYTHVGGSLRVVEGQEEEFDVDNYGNYVNVERSARVAVYDTKSAYAEEDFDDEEDDEEEDPIEAKKRERQNKNEAALNVMGKQSKWQRRALNIDQVLNQTFPKIRDSAAVKKAKKEEQVVELKTGANDPSAQLLLTSSSNKKKREKTKFEGARAEEEDSSESSEESATPELSDLSSDDSSDDEGLVINEGRKDSRRKKAIVENVGKLTTMELIRQQRKQVMKDNKQLTKQKERLSQKKKNKPQSRKGDKEEGAFEEIPVAMTDPTTRARTLAIATKMLDKRSRRDMMDNSINKYTNNDDDELPDWFIKDEQRNCKVFLPVTHDDIEYERNRFRELNARPSKKVMEAMGRKRRKASRMLRGMIEKGKSDPKAREKANKTSVRTLMRSQAIKGAGHKKKGPLDSMQMGVMKRQRQKAKRDKKK